VHTFFMRYAIDVVFVDADQVVLRVVPNLRPWKWATCRGARDVVELRAGESERADVAVGQRLAWAARPQTPPSTTTPTADPLGEFSRVSSDGATRVLLGTADDRFLRLARFLLTRENCEVEVTKRLARTVDLVERHRPNVVVIDATASLADAARAVAAMEALHPRIPVLVVCDGEPPRWTSGLKVTEKWEALETLTDDVQLLAAGERTWS
jgi:CBS domain-containing protein